MAKRFFNARIFSGMNFPRQAVEYLRKVDEDLAATEAGGINHNDLVGLQGGLPDERQHLTNAQLAALHPAVTVSDTSSVNLTITGQSLSADAIFGTDAGTVAEGNHGHAQLHDRSHAMTGTSDHTAGNWRVFYSNGSGQVVEVALGSAGNALISGGASSAPSFGSHNDISGLQGGTMGQYYHVREPQTAIPDAVGSDEVDRINDILAVLRTHGLIAT